MKKNLLTILFLYFGFISVVQAKVVILDVRTPSEYASEHVAEAVNIDVENADFTNSVKKLDRADEYKVYCRSGRRSAKAIDIMKSLGFKKIENLGGLEDAKKSLKK